MASDEKHPSGKKEKVMIACSTFEVAKIVEPAMFYGVERIYIVHYDKLEVYREYYEEVCRRIRDADPKMKIIGDYDKDEVYNFTKMMNTIMTIISKERNAAEIPDIYVNISSGTHEFTAAAVVASSMWDNTIAFTAPTEEFTVGPKKMKDVYYEDGRPLGLTKKTKNPIKISSYSIPQPDRILVLGLGLLSEMLKNGEKISAPCVINKLDSEKLMKKTMTESGKRPDQNCIMNYQRKFIDKWIANGWVERISKRDLKITPEGDLILKTFLESFRAQKVQNH